MEGAREGGQEGRKDGQVGSAEVTSRGGLNLLADCVSTPISTTLTSLWAAEYLLHAASAPFTLHFDTAFSSAFPPTENISLPKCAL